MSQINLSGLSLASSMAGGQQTRSDRNQASAEASRRDFRSTLDKLADRQQDVEDPDLDADRDADGRSLLDDEAATFEPTDPIAPPETESPPSQARIAESPELGNQLDIDA